MPETVAAINVLLFLLPGFVSQKMVDWLAAHGRTVDTETIRDALIFSLVNYLLYAVLAFGSHRITFTWSPFPSLPAVPLILSHEGMLTMHAQGVEALATLVTVSVVEPLLLAPLRTDGYSEDFADLD